MQDEDVTLLKLLVEIRDLSKKQAEILEASRQQYASDRDQHQADRDRQQSEREQYQKYLDLHRSSANVQRWSFAFWWVVGFFLFLAALRILSWPVPPGPTGQPSKPVSHVLNMDDPQVRAAHDRVQALLKQAREAGRPTEAPAAVDSNDAR